MVHLDKPQFIPRKAQGMLWEGASQPHLQDGPGGHHSTFHALGQVSTTFSWFQETVNQFVTCLEGEQFIFNIQGQKPTPGHLE